MGQSGDGRAHDGSWRRLPGAGVLKAQLSEKTPKPQIRNPKSGTPDAYPRTSNRGFLDRPTDLRDLARLGQSRRLGRLRVGVVVELQDALPLLLPLRLAAGQLLLDRLLK